MALRSATAALACVEQPEEKGLTKPIHALVVAATEEDTLPLVRELQNGGFALTFDCVEKADAFQNATRRQQPDIVLANDRVPGFAVWDVIGMLREYCPDISLVVISSVGDEETAAHLIRAGAAAVLPQGNLARLVPSVERELAVRNRQRGGQAGTEFYRLLIENTLDIVTVLSPEGTILYENPSIERGTGFKPEELIGHNSLEFIHPDDQRTVIGTIQAIAEGAPAGRLVQYRFRKSDGSWMHVESRGLLHHEKGQQRILVNSRDITARKQFEIQLTQLNRALRAISLCNQTLIRAKDESEFLNEVCRIVVEVAEYCACWIGFIQSDQTKMVKQVAQAGQEMEYFENIHINLEDTLRGDGATATAIKTGQMCVCHDTSTDSRFARWCDEARRHGIASAVSLPLFVDGQILGALSIYSQQINGFGENDLQLLKEFAGDIAIGIAALRTRAEKDRITEQLRIREERYALAMSATNDGLWSWNIPSGEVYFSPRWKEMLGYQDGELPNQLEEFRSRLHPDEKDKLLADLDRFTAGTVPRLSSEFRIRHKDGSYRWLYGRGAALRDDAGRAFYIAGAGTDITERKRAEENLRESEERFRRYFELGLIGMAITSPAKGMLAVNDELCRILGYTREELLQKSWAELTYPEDVASDVAQFDRVLAGETDRYRLDKRFLRKDGRVIDTTISVTCVRRQDGSVDYFMGMLQDITEQKRTAAALTLFRTLLDRVTDSIEVIDPETGRVLDVNEAACTSHGYTREEYLSLRIPELDPTMSGLNAWARQVEKLRREGSVIAEGWHRRKDGSLFPMEFHATYARLDRDYLVTVVRDITVRKRQEEALRTSEYRFRRLMEVGIIGVRIANLRGETVEANNAFLQMLGYTHADLEAGQLHQNAITPATPSSQHALLMTQVRETGSFGPTEAEYAHRDGHPVPVLIGGALLEGEQPTIISFALDISEQRKREDELRRLWRAIEQSPASVIITDANGLIEYVNPKFTLVTGYASGEVIGKNPRILKSGQHTAEFYRQMWQTMMDGQEWHGELCNRAKNGRLFWEAASISPVRNGRGEVTHYIGVKEDISIRKEAERRLEHLALHDPLTGLPNRALFHEEITRAMARAQRNKTQFALFFLDLDRFKNINDTLGHPAGDELLRQVASRLRNALRASDTIARLGGDEFAILICDFTSAEAVAVVARKVLHGLAETFHIAGQEVHTSGSLGITLFPTDATDAEGLCRNADLALYQAKRTGRNRLCFFSEEMDRDARARAALESDLRRAIEHNELFLLYQPIVSLTDDSITRVEALVRWRNPLTGVVSPGQFIPVAEESGLIIPMGEWVLRAACWQLRRWQDQGMNHRVSVNISPAQFRHEDFAEMVTSTLSETGVNPAGLDLEVTETSLMHDIQVGSRMMTQLHQLGIRFSIDDFGTGYSSLNYLRRLPADTLKIDQSFVRDIAIEPHNGSIVKAIIHLGHDLHMRVLAEGVETETQVEYLQAHGCDEVQGFLYSRPVTAGEIDALLKQPRKEPQMKTPSIPFLSIPTGSPCNNSKPC